MSMLSPPFQSAVMSMVPTGGKSIFWALEPPGRTLKFVPSRSVRTACGAGVADETGVGFDPDLLPPQVENDKRASEPMRAEANARLFIGRPPGNGRAESRYLELRRKACRYVGPSCVAR